MRSCRSNPKPVAQPATAPPVLSKDDLRALKAYLTVESWPARYFWERYHPHRKLYESGYLSVSDHPEFGKVARITRLGIDAVGQPPLK
jgi:hypothetical protein